jgi:hypothetical protein
VAEQDEFELPVPIVRRENGRFVLISLLRKKPAELRGILLFAAT